MNLQVLLGRRNLINKAILPPSRIGIIGAGQLAFYMALEALKMGYKVSTFDPNPESPAKRVSDFTCASFDDFDALDKFASKCDVITYEFENMNIEHIESINKKYHLPQGSKILKHTAHRYEELKMAQALGIPTVNSVYLENGDSDKSDIYNLKLPLIVKTVRFGYDGKGQSRFYNYDHVEIETESLVSELIDFDYEISLILVRSNNEVQAYPPFYNVHKNSVLFTSQTIEKGLYKKAEEYAIAIAEAMEYEGTMAVEFFVKEGELIFNEVAPRPHNSGHLTLSVSNKCQFKAHIEAICHLEIGPLYHYEPALMVNQLGEEVVEARKFMVDSNIDHYEYGKESIKPGRKMGHAVYRNDAMIKKLEELGNE